MVPPPESVAPNLVRELEHLAGLRTVRARVAGMLRSWATRIDGTPIGPASGSFRLRSGGHFAEAAVEVDARPPGSRITLVFTGFTGEFSDSAALELRHLFENRRKTVPEAPRGEA